MSATALPIASSRNNRLVPERLLAGFTTLFLAAMGVAMARGYAHMHALSWAIWTHIALVAMVLAITPALMMGRHGGRLHRVLGYGWIALICTLAVLSFEIRTHGGLSPIHVLSVVTLVQTPVIALKARKHQVKAHRRRALGMVGGALVVSGILAFLPQRLLGSWMF